MLQISKSSPSSRIWLSFVTEFHIPEEINSFIDLIENYEIYTLISGNKVRVYMIFQTKGYKLEIKVANAT